MNDRNKVSFRYSMLNSNSDQIESNSNGQGLLGNRDNNANSMVFKNSNYKIKENNRSAALDLNSSFGRNKANDFIVGYFYSDESRDSLTGTFPLIDIEKDNLTYTSVGLRAVHAGQPAPLSQHAVPGQLHTVRPEARPQLRRDRREAYHSDNVFFPGSQSVYVYNSLADFYTDANGYLANPNRTVSPVNLLRFQVRYNNVPGQTQPLQPLQVLSTGAYAQDNWRIGANARITLGMRVDFHSFDSTALVNPLANAMTFRDGLGNAVQYKTQQFPKATPLWSPRLGFNYDVKGEHKTQIRGGTGIFSGSPPYVWISNQVGQNGILTGLTSVSNTTAFPFNPNADAYKPTTVTGAPAASYELDFTTNNFKFSQVWRSDVALDKKLPLGITATGEYIYNKDINGPSYINANLPGPSSNYAGVDARQRYPAVNKLNPSITAAYVIGNESRGYSWIGALSAERAFGNGFYAKAGYSYGEAKNTVDPGSTASTSWTTNANPGDPNNPALGFSVNSPGHRLFVAVSKRLEYFKFGATTVSLYYNAAHTGQRELHLLRRRERRRIVDQRPDLHPEGRVGDELQGGNGQRHHLHSAAAGRCVGSRDQAGLLPQRPSRAVRRAQRRLPSDGEARRHQHRPGSLRPHQGCPERIAVPARHPERRQPDQQELGPGPDLPELDHGRYTAHLPGR